MRSTFEGKIVEVVEKTGVLSRSQLIKYGEKVYNISAKTTEDAIRSGVRNGALCVTPDNYVIAQSALDIVSRDVPDFDKSFKSICNIKNPLHFESSTKAIIEAFWLTLEFMPDSRDFFVSRSSPFVINFLDSDGNIVQIAYFRQNMAFSACHLIRENSSIEPEMRNQYIRIAIVENEFDADTVAESKNGFQYVCSIRKTDTQFPKIMILKKVEEGQEWG